MNKRERVLRAYRGERPDRVPAAFWYHFPSDCVYGEKAVQAHLDFIKRETLALEASVETADVDKPGVSVAKL